MYINLASNFADVARMSGTLATAVVSTAALVIIPTTIWCGKKILNLGIRDGQPRDDLKPWQSKAIKIAGHAVLAFGALAGTIAGGISVGVFGSSVLFQTAALTSSVFLPPLFGTIACIGMGYLMGNYILDQLNNGLRGQS